MEVRGKAGTSDPHCSGLPSQPPHAGQGLGWRHRDLPRDATIPPSVLRWRSAWPGSGSAAQESPTYYACNLCPYNMEMRICVFPNSSPFQRKFIPARDKRGCGGSLHSKRNKRKQRDTSFPSPEWPVDLFPGKICGRRGGSDFVAAAKIQSLPAQPSPVLRSGVLSPKGNRASGVGPEGFALSSPGPNHLPTGSRVEEGR